MPGNIFISYRRAEGIKDARSFYERLAREFGETRVFIDLEGIEPGEDFGEALERHLDGCAALVALIGPDWATARNAHGEKRLDDESDFVRIELCAALRRGIKVFPVLIDGAMPPRATDLPEPLRPLVRRQAIVLDYAKFDSDVERLARAIRKAIDDSREADDPVVVDGKETRIGTVRPSATPGKPSGQEASSEETASAVVQLESSGVGNGGGTGKMAVALLVAVVASIGVVLFALNKYSGSARLQPAAPSNQVTTITTAPDDTASKSIAHKSRDRKPKSGTSGGDVDSKQTPPKPATPIVNFAGRWIRTFPADGDEMVAYQTGRSVRFEMPNLTDYHKIDDAGRAISKTMYAQDDKVGHEVSTEAEADLIVTVVSTVDGDVLTNDVTSDYRRPFFGQPVHVEKNQTRFKRQ